MQVLPRRLSTKLRKDLAEASNALLKASIESIAHQKMTQLQEKKFAIEAVESGMTRGQIDGYRALIKEIEKLIHELGKSNYLVYDKVIRNQKVANIDSKMAILETLRINAAGVSSSLSGYFGNSNSGRRGMTAIGGVGTTSWYEHQPNLSSSQELLQQESHSALQGSQERCQERTSSTSTQHQVPQQLTLMQWNTT